MNKEDAHIDKLTRDLMEGTAEQTSTSLLGRIMERVMQEKKMPLQKTSFSKLPSPGRLFGGLVVYLLVVLGVFQLFASQPESAGIFGEQLKNAFPLLLTVATGISFFFFFSQLDNWLRMKEKKHESKD